VVLYFVLFTILSVVLEPSPKEQEILVMISILGAIFLGARFIAKFQRPAWSISLDEGKVVLKGTLTKRIPLKNIQFVHTGRALGMQSPQERKRTVPLTLEYSLRKKASIHLAPGEAQVCIDFLTNTAPWIGGMSVSGEYIVPKDPDAAVRFRRRASRFYLYAGVPALVLGIAAAISWTGMVIGLIERSGRWAMVAQQAAAIPMLIGYGLWNIRNYRKLQRMSAVTPSGAVTTSLPVKLTNQ
jgi:hypothetical protein